MMHLGRLMLLAVGGLLVCAGHARAEVEERWFVILLEGEKAGWMMERNSTGDDGQYTQEVEMQIRIDRGVTPIEMGMRSASVEEADGTPVRLSSSMKQALMEMGRVYDFTGTKVIERLSQGGRTVVNTLDMPGGEWMMPGEARRKIDALRDAGETEYSIKMLDVSAGLQVVEMTTKVLGETVVDVYGKKVPAVEHEVTNSLMPTVKTTEFVDWDGQMVRTAISLGPGLTLEIRLADEAIAKSEFDAPELMASTLIKPAKPIVAPRKRTFGRYILRVGEGELPEIVAHSTQQVNRKDARSAEVVVNTAWPEPIRDKIDRERYLAATSAADKNDPEIVKLVERATAGIPEGDKRARAEAMRKLVHTHMTGKSLAVGFATASEACRTREGDCSEHGVLLAAMLRADGIPSRVVSGLMYIDTFLGEDQVFGYHMWAQALLPVEGGEAWEDFDAMLPGEMRTDATHIALGTSDLSDNSTLNSMVSLGNLLGQLDIEVVETR